jgi:hypothetical protein
LTKIIEYLTKYLSTGKDFSKDLALFERFTNINELVDTVENALKLLDLLKKYDGSVRL